MANILRKFYMGLKSAFPSHEPGAVLYSTDENGLYIDSKTKRNRINPPADWEETDQNSPSYIANKPEIDDTLTVSGAIADAKAVGDELENIKHNFNEQSVLSIPQTLTDSQKNQAKANLGLHGVTAKVLFDGIPNGNEVILQIDSNNGNVSPGDKITYHITMLPVENYTSTGYLALFDKDGNYLESYGRKAITQTETDYSGVFEIPENFSYSNWRSHAPLNLYLAKEEVIIDDGEIRYDTQQNLTNIQKAQARENIGLDDNYIATTQNNGFMSATDKARLDEIWVAWSTKQFLTISNE